MNPWSVTTRSAAQTGSLGRLLGELLSDGQIILLCGDLGSGKTCFSQGVARGLGLAEDVAITSPSYTLMNQYSARLELHHFDLYRLCDPDELVELGFDHYLGGAGVSIVEWADRFELSLCESLTIRLSTLNADERQLLFEAQGAEHAALLDELSRRWT